MINTLHNFLPAKRRRRLPGALAGHDAALERDLQAARRRAELRGDAEVAARFAGLVATLRARRLRRVTAE